MNKTQTRYPRDDKKTGYLRSRFKASLYLLLAPFSLLIVVFMFSSVTFAQDPTYDEINEIAEQLNCPTCVGINLADCQTQTCNQWRSQIGDLLAEGKTEQEVLDYFALQYGTRVLMEPPVTGATMWLWILPIIALLAGGAWLGMLLRDWKKPLETAPAAEPSAVTSADYLKKVEEDLKT